MEQFELGEVLYRSLMDVEIDTNFKRGDLLRKQEKLKEFLDNTGESLASAKSLMWIAEQFPEEEIRRIPGVTWGHFKTCANTNNPKEWLLKAYNGRWSHKKLVNEIRAEKEKTKVDEGLRCKVCDNIIGKGDSYYALMKYNGKVKRVSFCSEQCLEEFIQSEELKI